MVATFKVFIFCETRGEHFPGAQMLTKAVLTPTFLDGQGRGENTTKG